MIVNITPPNFNEVNYTFLQTKLNIKTATRMRRHITKRLFFVLQNYSCLLFEVSAITLLLHRKFV